MRSAGNNSFALLFGLLTIGKGDVVYTEQDIYHAVAWGTLLQDADQTRGSKPHPPQAFDLAYSAN